MSFDVEGAAARTAELERMLAIEQAKNSVLLEERIGHTSCVSRRGRDTAESDKGASVK